MAGQSQHVEPSETEALMRPSRPTRAPLPHSADAAGKQLLRQDELEALFKGCTPASPAGSTWAPFGFQQLVGVSPPTQSATLDPSQDEALEVRIELGRAQMDPADVLKLRRGCVVPLDQLAGEPVDVYANGRLVARGEVLLLNQSYCVRVDELVPSQTACVV